MRIRGDFIFSNWIIIWFIIHYIGLIEYSPKIILIIGLIHNLYLLGLMILKRVTAKITSIIYFSLIIVFMKVIPLYIIRKDKIKVTDIIFTLLLFNLFLVWLILNRVDFNKVNMDIEYAIVNDTRDTPIMNLIDRLEKKFKGYFS
jgi:hypothetical protein